MKVTERLEALRSVMAREHVDAYIIPTDDYHASEYVGDYFKAREYMSGFTGSAGTLVVMADSAALWTDGRYFLQAEAQLEGSGIKLMKMGQPDVPEITNYLAEQVCENGVIGFDGRTVTKAFADRLAEKCRNKAVKFAWEKDLINEIWCDRPEMSAEPVWELSVQYAGKSRGDKLQFIREKMREKQVDYLLLTALDEIAWTLNIRGNDVAYTPVFLSYLLIDQKGAVLCANEEIFDNDIKKKLTEDGINIRPYNAITELLMSLEAGQAILIDKNVCGISLVESIPETVKIIDETSMVTALKAVKNTVESGNIQKAHIKDGVAVTRFIYWLKTNVGKIRITELDACHKINEFRSKMEGFIEPSFESIIAYGAHGAIVHYEPTQETDAELKPQGLCLADTGGHYLEGTTDITRTIPLGPLTDEEKRAYTLVLKGHLALSAAVFPEGATGENLDILAREPLWEAGLDFNHGTGHGVGYLLSVHEGPQRFGWRIRPGIKPVPLSEGMVISNEPGLYITGKFGIRHENLMMCKKGEKNAYGQFMHFINLTMVPFDKEAILPELLTETELKILNSYHNQVYHAISPFLSSDERKWLREATEPLSH